MAPVIAAVAKVVVAAIAKVTFAAVAKFVVTTALSIGISKLLAKRAMKGAAAGGEGGGRIQLPPATDNKIPVVYGTAFIGGSIIDAMLSTDQKTMWYVIALAEHTDTTVGTGYSFGDIYYDGKLVQFGSNGAVTGLITNNASPGSAQVDTRVNGYLNIYLFNNGSSSGTNTGGQTAAQILSVTNGVPASKAWSSSQAMTNCAFAIVKVKYSTDAGTTGVGALVAQMTNNMTKPGSCILDYMVNERYGCAIPLDRIDTQSLTDLNTYSDDLIDYKPVGWNPGDPYSQQARYRINGPLDTSQNCLDNLQFLVDSCDSWLQYSELTGLWRVVMNKGYDQAPNAETLSNLFLVDSSNLVGGIDISPIDLNETYNQVEVAYPNTNVKDQTDYQIIDLFTELPSLLSENEAVNRLNVTLPLVNNAVQAKYLAARRILQSREDLVITFKLDFSGIQVEAGDIIRVDHEQYGWGPIPGNLSNPSKLFRVSSVAEEKDEEGNLFAVLQAFEYNNTVYADDPVQDFIPAFNTGLLDPNVIDPPGTPVVTINPVSADGTTSFKIDSTVPAQGLVLYMDFNYGNSSNVQEHRLYRTVQQSNGDPYINSTSANIDVNDLPAGGYYFSVTARNNTAGRRSDASALFDWDGSVIPDVTSNIACNASSSGNTITSDQILNIEIGANVNLSNGTGGFASNTTVTGIISSNGTSTIFTVNPAPTTPLSGACIEVISGGVGGNIFRPNTTPGNTIASNSLPGNSITANTITNVQIQTNTIIGNNISANTITGNNITIGTLTGNLLANYTITNVNIANNTINSNNIQVGGIDLGSLSPFLNVSQVVDGFTYLVTNGSNVFPPVNVTTRTNLLDPFYIIGSNPGSSYYYPYFQGTSSTLDGYYANSTSSFYPADAALWAGIPGTFGWYKAVYANVSFPSLTQMPVIYRAQFVCDTTATIQLAIYGEEILFPGTMISADTNIQTIELQANKPQYVYINTAATAIGNVTTQVGIMIRNITTGANVISPQGSFGISRNQ